MATKDSISILSILPSSTEYQKNVNDKSSNRPKINTCSSTGADAGKVTVSVQRTNVDVADTLKPIATP